MSVRVGIMGFGRIGRNVFRIAQKTRDIDVVAVVDVADPKALEYLLRFDTVHGRFDEPFSVKENGMYIRGKQIAMITKKEPGEVDWAAYGVDIVVEATGKYRTRDYLKRHLEAGARKVILTVPPRDEIDFTVVMGVNDAELKAEHRIISNASCTTNALAPIAKILNGAFGIERAFLTSVHAYTNDQRLADVPSSEMRRSRAAAENIIPTDTWSVNAVMKMLPELDGKLSGTAMNVPVPDGSTLDFVTLMKRDVTATEINEVVWSAAQTDYKSIVEYATEPIVSSDVIGNSHSAIFDSMATMVVGGNMVKTLTWYDNGWGYANRVVELIQRLDALTLGR